MITKPQPITTNFRSDGCTSFAYKCSRTLAGTEIKPSEATHKNDNASCSSLNHRNVIKTSQGERMTARQN